MSKIKYQKKSIPVSECFDYMSGNSGLSATFIHNSRNDEGVKYDVLSSSINGETLMGKIVRKQLPNGKDMKVFEDKEGILVARNGNAGTMTFLPKGRYTINDHAYILYKKDDCPFEINLNWFIYSMKDFMQEFVTTKSGNATWSVTEFMNKAKIDIPETEFQNLIQERYDKVNQQIEELKQKYKEIEAFQLSIESESNMKPYDFLEIFTPKQGNAIYTRKNIYEKNWEGDIPVIGSSNENEGILEHIDLNFVKPKDYVRCPCLTWAVDGNAGKLFIRNCEEDPKGFVFNNHCGVLFINDGIKNLYLPYILNFLQPIFFDLAKNANNKKLGNNQIEKIKIMIPVTKNGEIDIEKQKQLVKKHEAFVRLKNDILREMNKLLNLNIVL